MLRINITIPSDLYEECQKKCEKQRISFSQLVRTALINHQQSGFSIQSTQSEEEVKKIVDSAISSHLSILQQRMTDIEKYIHVLHKIPLESTDSSPTNIETKKGSFTKKP